MISGRSLFPLSIFTIAHTMVKEGIREAFFGQDTLHFTSLPDDPSTSFITYVTNTLPWGIQTVAREAYYDIIAEVGRAGETEDT